MSEVGRHHLVVASFADENKAAAVLNDLLQARKGQTIAMPAGAVVRKDSDGLLDIRETDDVGGAAGAVAGGVLGGLLGMLTGRARMGTGLGALLGGIGASKQDTGIPDSRLAAIGERLKPGMSAVAAIIGDESLDAVSATLRQAGGEVASDPIVVDHDVARQLQEGNYGAALSSLANLFESAVADASVRSGELAQTVGGKAQELAGQAQKAAQELLQSQKTGDTPAATAPETAAAKETDSEPPAV